MALDASKDHLKDHRARLRKRFIDHGGDSLADHETLELMLFGVLPRIDTKPLAKRMLAAFDGDLGQLLAAPLGKLMQIDGVGETVAIHLKVIGDVMVRTNAHTLKQAPIIGSWSVLLSYVRRKLSGETHEQFRVMFLDKKLRLIADELLGAGTVDHAPVYPREVARRALERAASSVILVHNHPSGDPSPSQADIMMTKEIIAALKPLGISVHDHLIVGLEGTNSLKAMGLM